MYCKQRNNALRLHDTIYSWGGCDVLQTAIRYTVIQGPVTGLIRWHVAGGVRFTAGRNMTHSDTMYTVVCDTTVRSYALPQGGTIDSRGGVMYCKQCYDVL